MIGSMARTPARERLAGTIPTRTGAPVAAGVTARAAKAGVHP